MELSGLVSRATSGLDEREVKEVLEGHLTTDLAKPVSKYIRIFLSSDLTDSVLERKFLRERVFSHLRQFSLSLGLQFHIVDIYHSLPATWLCQETEADNEEEEERGDDIEGEEVGGGSSRLSVEESSRNSGGIDLMCELELQGVLQLALREIQVCQDMSAGPTFVTLQAQKYGHKPLPRHIPNEEFTLLCDTMLDSADERQLVQQWYQLDSNALPPQYTLLQHFDENWVNTQKMLSATLRKAAKLALGKDPSKVQKYIMSASEAEVTAGLFQLKADPNHCCLWSKRTFVDLLEQRGSDPALCQFCDLVTGQRGLEFDSEALKSLNHLKEARMPAKYIGLDSSNIFEFPIKWERGKGLDPDSCPPHEDYLIQMCERVCHTLQEHISHAADIVHMQTCNATYQEVLVHSTHCQKIAQTYMDRPDISGQIQSYLDGPSDHPLVVYSPTGYGKTAVMASAAHRLRERNPVSSMAIIVRFLGLTPHSSSILHTLRSMSKQIMAVYDVEDAVIPGDYQGVAAHFTSSLHRASVDKPLYLFLDAVDQLSPEDGASGMSWLPLDLPPHVKLVLSTSSEVEYRCFPVLQSLMAKHAGSLVQVPQLSEVECQQMLSHCLSLEQRTLIPQQMDTALTALQQCPVPLFLQLILRSWKSYSTLQDPLPTTIDGAVESFYTELEEKYGKTLISHFLAYVTASKHGLTEPEILDILALDTEVITEVNVKYGRDGCTALTCLPPAIWAQLSLHIQPLLTYQAGVDHSLVLRWCHRRLREMVETRYLTHRTEQVYGMLAEYFGSRGSGIKGAANQDAESGSLSSLQQVENQPLLLNADPVKFNIRKLTELPYALAKCGQNAYQTLTELLLDYQWLKTCVLSLPCRDILHDFTPVIPPVPIGRSSTDVDHELRLLRQALMYSTTVLNVDCSQFCVQLAGRLLPYITNCPEKYPILRNLVMTALEDMAPLLTPLQPLSHIPGGPHLVSMEGHRDIVSCMSTVLVEGEQGASLILVTSSWDKTLKSWDLATTGVLKTFDGHSDRVLSVALSVDGVYAASGSDDKSVRYWYVPTAECIHVMKGHSAAVNAVAVTDDASKTVSASSDGTVKIWNTDQNSSSCGQLIYTLRSHKKPVLTAVLRGNVLASGTSSGCIFFTDIVSGEQLKMVQGHNVAVTALAAETVDGCCYLVSGAADQSVKVWDFNTCNLLHSLPTTTGMDSSAGISSLSIGSNGRLIVSNGQREPGIWDLKSGTHLYSLPRHTAGVESTAMTDSGRLAITGSSGPSLQIWDVLSPPVSHTTRLHREDITSIAISACGGLGVCASQSGSICVFDTDTMSTIQQLQPHSAVVNHVLSYKDINKLFSASSDGTISLWDGETGEVLQRFEAQESAINCLAITMTKDLLMTGSQNGEVAFWSIDTGKKLKTFSDHTTSVITVAFIKQKKDQFMLSSSKDGNLCIREFQTAKVVVTTHLHTGELNSTYIAPNATFMVCGSIEGLSYIISLPYGTIAAVLTGHSSGVNTVKVTPDSTKCVTGSDDCTIRVWSIKDSECMAVLYVDAPVLACDVNYNMTILYGTEGGWVSTAAFQVDPTKPNALISQLKARNSPTNKSSSTTASPSPLDSRIEVPQIKGNGGSNDITDQGEENLPPTSNTCDSKIIPLPTEPDDATISFDGTKTVLHGCMENGKLTHGPSTGTIETSKSTTAGAESTLPTSDESTMKNKANSLACILL